MEFGEQIKNLRIKNNLTQEQFAEKLHVTRQVVSNWENNRNLPDLEMLILIAEVFQLSLDTFILGGTHVNTMTQKLIKDGSETRRAKFNLFSIIMGTILLCLSFACFLIKGLSVEYIDAAGILHENFFLLPMGFIFLLAGFTVFLVFATKYFLSLRKN